MIESISLSTLGKSFGCWNDLHLDLYLLLRWGALEEWWLEEPHLLVYMLVLTGQRLQVKIPTVWNHGRPYDLVIRFFMVSMQGE